MFYLINEELFHAVLTEPTGMWLISYQNPNAPAFYRNNELMQFKKSNPPSEYIKRNDTPISCAEQKKLTMIHPLLTNHEFITDSQKRSKKVAEIAQENQVSERTIFRLFYLCLATGRACRQYKRKDKINIYDEYFKRAINQYYYSAKKNSLRGTYECMLLNDFLDQNGRLLAEHPNWNEFKYFFYKNQYNKTARKEIRRDGLSDFERNKKSLFGNAYEWRDRLGYYQMDATEADIYLVSSFDPDITIGRPVVYTAVDTLTGLIAGINVTLSQNSQDVMGCIVNAAANKVLYCDLYGIKIKQEQWPSIGLPKGIITDQGNDFTGKKLEQLCKRYDVEIETLPPFRPDRKGLVEKMFDLMQQIYKPILRKKGVIEADAKERWAVDYRDQAVLTLREFTKIIILCVLYLNNQRIVRSYIQTADMVKAKLKVSPSSLWKWFLKKNYDDTIPVDQRELYLLSLPRDTATISKKGIFYKQYYYINTEQLNLIRTLGNKKVTIAYDDIYIDKIFLVIDHEYIEFSLPEEYRLEKNMNRTDQELWIKEKRNVEKSFEHERLQAKIDLTRWITEIADK